MGSDSVRRRRHSAGALPRRPTDRIEDGLVWLLTAAVLLLAVLAGVVANAVHRDGTERARLEAALRHQVVATVLADPDDRTPATAGAAAAAARRYATVPARWTGPGGVPITGRVQVGRPAEPARPAGRTGAVGSLAQGAGAVTAGDELTIWVDADGGQSRPPTDPAQVVQAAIVAAVVVVLFGLIVLGGVWMAGQALIAHSNDRRWERDWARVGPRWSRRVH